MNEKWKKVALEILKYAIGAILGALGLTATGCVAFPQFIF